MAAEKIPEKAESRKTSTSRTSLVNHQGTKEFSEAGAWSTHVNDTDALGASAITLNMTVNGRRVTVQVEPHWVLRDVLRQKLGLTSIKDFCNGYGACGSCTVLMNGRPVLSCMVLSADCEGAVIETVEGIADAQHPLIEAYIMNWAAQCGYCTPGFIVTAKALLDRNPDPTVDEIKEALAGNLCRCGTYPAHVKAILEAAKKLRGEE